MHETFFAMRNVHSRSCGEPLVFRKESGEKYFGYFENALGEQWVFAYDHASKTAELFGGDAGWQNAFQVVDGRANGVVLGRHEIEWLLACWQAATGGK